MSQASEEGDQAAALRDVATGMGRAVGGALLFSLPMLMTMELWELGFYMGRLKLALLLVLMVPLLVGVAHRIGFEPSFGWREDIRDAFIALGIGLVTSAVVLAIFGILDTDMSVREVVGKIAVQSVPAALGALLARSQFGGDRKEDDDEKEEDGRAFSSYFGTLFMMIVGSIYFSLNVAPTEEMILISYTMTPVHAALLVALSIGCMHAFVYAVEFQGGPDMEPGGHWVEPLLRVTLPGYVLAFAISVFVLWIFERTGSVAPGAMLMATVVLAFPASIGAAAARLIL